MSESASLAAACTRCDALEQSLKTLLRNSFAVSQKLKDVDEEKRALEEANAVLREQLQAEKRRTGKLTKQLEEAKGTARDAAQELVSKARDSTMLALQVTDARVQLEALRRELDEARAQLVASRAIVATAGKISVAGSAEMSSSPRAADKDMVVVPSRPTVQLPLLFLKEAATSPRLPAPSPTANDNSKSETSGSDDELRSCCRSTREELARSWLQKARGEALARLAKRLQAKREMYALSVWRKATLAARVSAATVSSSGPSLSFSSAASFSASSSSPSLLSRAQLELLIYAAQSRLAAAEEEKLGLQEQLDAAKTSFEINKREADGVRESTRHLRTQLEALSAQTRELAAVAADQKQQNHALMAIFRSSLHAAERTGVDEGRADESMLSIAAEDFLLIPQRLTELSAANVKLEALNKRLGAQIDSKDALVKSLVAEVESLKTELSQRQALLSQARADVEEESRRRQAMESRLKVAEAKVADAISQVQDEQARLKECKEKEKEMLLALEGHKKAVLDMGLQLERALWLASSSSSSGSSSSALLPPLLEEAAAALELSEDYDDEDGNEDDGDEADEDNDDIVGIEEGEGEGEAMEENAEAGLQPAPEEVPAASLIVTATPRVKLPLPSIDDGDDGDEGAGDGDRSKYELAKPRVAPPPPPRAAAKARGSAISNASRKGKRQSAAVQTGGRTVPLSSSASRSSLAAAGPANATATATATATAATAATTGAASGGAAAGSLAEWRSRALVGQWRQQELQSQLHEALREKDFLLSELRSCQEQCERAHEEIEKLKKNKGKGAPTPPGDDGDNDEAGDSDGGDGSHREPARTGISLSASPSPSASASSQSPYGLYYRLKSEQKLLQQQQQQQEHRSGNKSSATTTPLLPSPTRNWKGISALAAVGSSPSGQQHHQNHQHHQHHSRLSLAPDISQLDDAYAGNHPSPATATVATTTMTTTPPPLSSPFKVVESGVAPAETALLQKLGSACKSWAGLVSTLYSALSSVLPVGSPSPSPSPSPSSSAVAKLSVALSQSDDARRAFAPLLAVLSSDNGNEASAFSSLSPSVASFAGLTASEIADAKGLVFAVLSLASSSGRKEREQEAAASQLEVATAQVRQLSETVLVAKSSLHAALMAITAKSNQLLPSASSPSSSSSLLDGVLAATAGQPASSDEALEDLRKLSSVALPLAFETVDSALLTAIREKEAVIFSDAAAAQAAGRARDALLQLLAAAPGPAEQEQDRLDGAGGEAATEAQDDEDEEDSIPISALHPLLDPVAEVLAGLERRLNLTVSANVGSSAAAKAVTAAAAASAIGSTAAGEDQAIRPGSLNNVHRSVALLSMPALAAISSDLEAARQAALAVQTSLEHKAMRLERRLQELVDAAPSAVMRMSAEKRSA